MREFADASREVDAADCAADGDPRELLQRQGACVEVPHESPHVVMFGLAVIIRVVYTSPFEMLIANGQVTRVQFPTFEAECQKLICNANASFQFCNQPEDHYLVITKYFINVNDVSVKERKSVTE